MNKQTVIQINVIIQTEEVGTGSILGAEKAHLRAIFSQHYRKYAKTLRDKGHIGAAMSAEYKARKLEAKIVDYADGLLGK